MVKTAPDILKTLWEDGFFKTAKSFRDIQSATKDKGCNPKNVTLYSALKRAKYLTRSGSVGNYKFIQLFNFNDSHTGGSFNKINDSKILKERDFHPKIIQVCNRLFADGHYSQAIFEAFKIINIMVKEKSGLHDLDGKDLMAKAFSYSAPKLRWSSINTISGRNEQEGFMFIFMGAMVGIRNPKAHDHIIQNDKIKALEYLTFASLLAKRVDESEKC